MKILLSWSSGKDSAWALHVLNRQHPGAVQALLTTVNEAVDRVAMHAVRREVLEAQARGATGTEAKNAEKSLLARAKVLLTPGTEIEYATVESRIAGDFQGWDGRTLFTLENGQRWQADGSGSYVTSPIARPAVKIAPGVLGSFWMTVEGVKSRVKVKLVSGGK